MENTNETKQDELPATIDTKVFTEMLLEQVRAAGGTEAFYKKHDVIRELTKATFQALLNAEMEEHLGYQPNEREAKDTANSRNGKGKKKVRGDFGEIELETPRDRAGSFDPKLIKKRQSSDGNFAAELALLEFEEKWGKRYPMSIASWKNNWSRLTTFFRYPAELRKMVYTTNAIESLNAQMRKNTSNRKVFPNDEAVIKILFLNVRNFTHRWAKRQGWNIVMNQLSMMFPDRLTPEAIDTL
jgi:transposase-like protein